MTKHSLLILFALISRGQPGFGIEVSWCQDGDLGCNRHSVGASEKNRYDLPPAPSPRPSLQPSASPSMPNQPTLEPVPPKDDRAKDSSANPNAGQTPQTPDLLPNEKVPLEDNKHTPSGGGDGGDAGAGGDAENPGDQGPDQKILDSDRGAGENESLGTAALLAISAGSLVLIVAALYVRRQTKKTESSSEISTASLDGEIADIVYT